MHAASDGDSIEVIEQFGDGLLAFEMAPAPLFTVLPSGIILKLNRALRELLGYAEGELPGRSFEEVLAPESRTEARARFEAVMGGSTPSPESRYDALGKSGQIVAVRVSSMSVRDASGTIRYIIGRVRPA